MAQATIDTTVSGIQGIPVAATAPQVNQALIFNGTSWVPTTPQYLSIAGGNLIGPLTVGGLLTANNGITATGNLGLTGTQTIVGSEIINLSGGSLPATPVTNTAPALRVSPPYTTAVGAVGAWFDYWQYGAMVFRLSGGPPSAPSAPVPGQTLGDICWMGWAAGAYQTLSGVIIRPSPVEAWTSAAQGTYIGFGVTPAGALPSAGTIWPLEVTGANGGGVVCNNPLTATYLQFSTAVNNPGACQFALDVVNPNDVGGSGVNQLSIWTAMPGWAGWNALVVSFNQPPGYFPAWRTYIWNGGGTIQFDSNSAGYALVASTWSSDRSIKSNARKSTSKALDKVNALIVYEADHTAPDYFNTERKTVHFDHSWIADEVEMICPQAVLHPDPEQTPRAIASLNTQYLVPILWQAVQELAAEVKALRGAR